MFNTHFKPVKRNEAVNELMQLPFIAWTEQMRVDVKQLDNDHKRLAILTNDLYIGVVTGCAKQILIRDFEILVRHIRDHFAHEEKLFAEFRYPGAANHAHQHNILMDRIMDLRARFKRETKLAGLLDSMNLLKGWLFGHIHSSDQKYTSYLKVKNTDFNLAPRQSAFELIRERMTFGPRVVQGSWPA